MSLFDEGLNRIEDGLRGENVGLPHGFTRLMEYIPNTQQATYYLLGGETGSGKTSLTDDMFMYNPYDYLYDPKQYVINTNGLFGIKLNKDQENRVELEAEKIKGEIDRLKLELSLVYYSFEIEKIIKIIKGVCRRLYYKYNIIVDVNYVLSRGKNRIATEIYEKVKETRDYFERLETVLDIHDIPTNPTGISKHLKSYFMKCGTIHKVDDYRFRYLPRNKNRYNIVIVDHIALSKKEQGFTTKENIDKLSEYLVLYRNKFSAIPVVISQFNRSISSTDRFKLEMVKPQLSDFKDTGNPQQDANTIMGIFSPNRYSIPKYGGYNVSALGDRFRGLSILKNRDGTPDISVGLGYIGEVGVFRELPPATKLVSEDHYQNLLKAIEDKKFKDSSI